jgi:hypothetical protein
MDNVGIQTAAVTEETEHATMSFSQTALSLNSAAMSGATLYMSFDKLENAQVALDRAQVTVQRSTDAVTSAQKSYNDAVKKYGENSAEAQAALAKLKTAQDAHNVAIERGDVAQRNYNNSMIMTALTVIPNLISVISAVSHATEIWEGIQAALNVVMDANPIILVAAAIAGLVAAIIWAYENCKPFRDIVNEIGKLFADVFQGIIKALTVVWNDLTASISAVYNALKWLWDNVFAPFGSFLISYFINSVLIPLKTVWDAITAALTWAYNNILKPVADFFRNVLAAAINIVMVPLKAFMDAINWIINAGKAVLDFIGGLGKSLMNLCFAHAAPAAALFNETIADSMELTDKLTGKVAGLGDNLKALAGVNAVAMPVVGAGLSMSASVGAGVVPTSPAKAPVTVNITVPLVNVEGNADKATVDLASKQVLQQLKTVVVEATSSQAASTQKRIRRGAVFT